MDNMTLCQKLDLLEPLMGFIAHRLNNSLAIINGYTEMLKIDCKDNEQSLEKIHKIVQSSQIMSDFMLELLLLSDRCPLNVHNKRLNEVYDILDKRVTSYFDKRFSSSNHLSEHDLMIDVDIEQLEIAILAMLKAFDKVSFQKCSINLDLMLNDSNPCLMLEVSDLGHLDSVEGDMFDPFDKESSELKPDALALLLFYSIVKKHDWHMDANYKGKLLSLKISFK